MIKGDRVQDAGYRLFLLDAAEDLGLKGFQARNIKDYVEFIVEGDDDRVIEFIEFAKSNYPEFAKAKCGRRITAGKSCPWTGFTTGSALTSWLK